MADYKDLEKKDVSVVAVLKWYAIRIVDSIKQKLSFWQKIKDPWKIHICESMCLEIFIDWFKILRDYEIEYGRTVDVIHDKRKIGKVYTITFS